MDIAQCSCYHFFFYRISIDSSFIIVWACRFPHQIDLYRFFSDFLLTFMKMKTFRPQNLFKKKGKKEKKNNTPIPENVLSFLPFLAIFDIRCLHQ